MSLHFDLPEGRAIEPYAKAEVIEEFLTGNTIRTDSTNFDSSLSGTTGDSVAELLPESANRSTFTVSTITSRATISSSPGPLMLA